jgi:hypothetical protein
VSSLSKKLAIILLAVLSSTLLFATQTALAEEKATGKCPASFDSDDPAGEVTGIYSAHTDDLEKCWETLNAKAKAATAKCAKDGDLNSEDCKKKTKFEQAQKDLNTTIQAKRIRTPIKNYVKDLDPPVKDLSVGATIDDVTKFPEEKGNQCLSYNEAIKITTFIEEPLDIDTDNTTIRNCVRNTFCVLRDDKTGMECVTYNNKEDFCSEEAQAYVNMPENKGKASIKCTPIQVFLSQSGTDLLYIYIGAIYRWAASVIGIIAVLIMVISGIQISAAAGDQQAVTNAKNRLFQSMAGLALLFLSAIILFTINPTFFTGPQ